MSLKCFVGGEENKSLNKAWKAVLMVFPLPFMRGHNTTKGQGIHIVMGVCTVKDLFLQKITPWKVLVLTKGDWDYPGFTLLGNWSRKGFRHLKDAFSVEDTGMLSTTRACRESVLKYKICGTANRSYGLLVVDLGNPLHPLLKTIHRVVGEAIKRLHEKSLLYKG